MWNVIIPAAAGYIMDKSQGGKGWKGAAMGAAGGYAGGKGAPGGSILGDTAANTTATGLNSGNLLTSGGAGNALGLESAVSSSPDMSGAFKGIDYGASNNQLGIDLMQDMNVKGIAENSNNFGGYNLGASSDSGLKSFSDKGINASYSPGDPFYNPNSTEYSQNLELFDETAFKRTDGFDIDDEGFLNYNEDSRELMQPVGTDRELTLQDYAGKGFDKLKDLGGKAVDYAYENPDKVVMGGLGAASLLEESRNKNSIIQTVPGGFKQANVSGLNVPNSNGQYIYREPKTKRRTLLG